MKYTYKSLLCLGDYKEDTFYIDLSTGELKKSVAHKASTSKIFLSSIIGYHVLGFGLFKSIESNEVLSNYLLFASFVLSIIAAIVFNKRLYKNIEFEKVELTKDEYAGFQQQVKNITKPSFYSPFIYCYIFCLNVSISFNSQYLLVTSDGLCNFFFLSILYEWIFYKKVSF